MAGHYVKAPCLYAPCLSPLRPTSLLINLGEQDGPLGSGTPHEGGDQPVWALFFFQQE